MPQRNDLKRAAAAAAEADPALLQRRWFPDLSALAPGSRERCDLEVQALNRFVVEACKTVDEHDADNPLKPLPLDELPYARVYLSVLVRHRRVFVPKSRQIMATWTTFCYVLWRLLYAPYQRWAWVSKDKEDGVVHVEDRLKAALWENLPKWLSGQFELAQAKGSFLLMKRNGAPWRSTLWTYPQGADQLRQYAHAGVVIDEAAHQPGLNDMWKAMMPTVRGRESSRHGQVVLISSAKRGSYFQRLLGKDIREAVRIARAA